MNNYGTVYNGREYEGLRILTKKLLPKTQPRLLLSIIG